jgi:hypothetical protein
MGHILFAGLTATLIFVAGMLTTLTIQAMTMVETKPVIYAPTYDFSEPRYKEL